ncbi:MAG: hypothetical protein U1F70_10830 [Candidatus Competibacteraceae bacterium]
MFAAIYLVAADDSVYAVGTPNAAPGQRDNLLGLDLSHRLPARGAEEHNGGLVGNLPVGGDRTTRRQPGDSSGRAHVLVGEIAIDELAKFLNRSPAEAGMVTMILDRQEAGHRHSQAALTASSSISATPPTLVRDALAGRFVTGELTLDGQRFIGTPVASPAGLDRAGRATAPRRSSRSCPPGGRWPPARWRPCCWRSSSAGYSPAASLDASVATPIRPAIAGGDFDQPWPITWIPGIRQPGRRPRTDVIGHPPARARPGHQRGATSR